MKTIVQILFLISFNANADVIVKSLFKYGPNGYNASGANSISTSGKGKNYHYNSINSLNVENKVQLVPGLGLEFVPRNDGVTFELGYCTDQSLITSLGYKF